MRRHCWVAWGSSLLLACGADAEDPNSYAAGRSALCDGLHAGLRRCGLPGAESDYCGYNPTGFRGSSLAAVGACLRDEDCNTLALEQPAEACFDEVTRHQPVSQGAIDYCESAATAYFRCNSWWSVAECAQQSSIWSDEVLESAMLCHDHPCDTLASCERLAFEAKQ